MYKFIHILSNVNYGGGEQVLYKLCTDFKKDNYLFLLRKTKSAPNLKNINNKSVFNSKDNYKSIFDHLLTFSYLICLIIKLRIDERNFKNIVLHGFPSQYSLLFIKFLFPKVKIYIIYHQIKHQHKNLKILIRIIESLIIFITKPYIGAPSSRSLNSIKSYLPSILKKKLTFFLFKNCFSPIKDSIDSKILFNKISYLLNNKPYILSVARFEDFKGHLRLLQFIKRNNLFSNKLNFVFIGNGKTFLDCQKYIKKEKMNNIFLIGTIPREMLYQIYLNSEAVFIPSYEEAFGMQIIEAQFFKKSILVFESSLKINNNINVLNEFCNVYNIKNMKDLFKWKENHNNPNFIYSASDTMNSLESIS